jgi:hypothetical protein
MHPAPFPAAAIPKEECSMFDRLNILVLDLYSRLQLQREEGQGTVEYVMIFAAVAAMATLIVGLLSGALQTKITSIKL